MPILKFSVDLFQSLLGAICWLLRHKGHWENPRFGLDIQPLNELRGVFIAEVEQREVLIHVVESEIVQTDKKGNAILI